MPANLLAFLQEHYPIAFPPIGAAEALWIPIYILMIRMGHKQKTYAMPFIAISMNLALDAIFSTLGPLDHPELFPQTGGVALLLWWVCLAFQSVIVWQFIKYGRTEPGLPAEVRKNFYSTQIVLFILFFIGEYTFMIFNADWDANQLYFITCLIMSVLFVVMFYERRETLRGLSYGAAWLRMISNTVAGG